VTDDPRQALLVVDGLSVDRGERRVVDDASFVVCPGDLVAVVGPNGAGKTTLFAGLLGLIPMRARRVSLAGTFAFVPQHGTADRAFPVTALDVVLMGAYRRAGLLRRIPRHDRDLAAVALARVGLADRARVPFGELSGGQQQRVLLARALVQMGTVLLLDEPLSGVDAVSEEAIMLALAEERADGRAVLMATHDLALARSRCTHALLLNGKVHGFGAPEVALGSANLRAAYGERLVVLDAAGGTEAIDEGSHHDHGLVGNAHDRHGE
jgi:ABC-type Mn2+/Zn2+ transport system ATPase subunit